MKKQRLRTMQLIDLYIKGYLSLRAYEALVLANKQQSYNTPVAGIPQYKKY